LFENDVDQCPKPSGALPQRWITIRGVYVREQSVASRKLARRECESLLC